MIGSMMEKKMNKKQLSKYYYLTLEIKDIETKIQEIESTIISSSKLTGMPHGSIKSDPVSKKAELLVTLKKRLEKRKEEAMQRMIEIENYIAEIDDSAIKLIFTKRYIELKKWYQIANEMFMSERSVYRKHSSYFRRSKHD